MRRKPPFVLKNRIHELRKARGLTVEELAAQADMSPSYVSLMASGARNISVSNMKKLALAIKTHDFAPGAIAGIEGQYPFLAEGWSEQQLAEIVGKDPDGFAVGAGFQLSGQFVFQGRGKKPLVTIVEGLGHFGLPRTCRQMSFFQESQAIFFGRPDGERQDFFLSTAEHGEQSVSGGLCGRLSPVEIVFIFFTQGHVLFHNLGFDRRLLVEEAAQFGPGGLVLADVFGNDHRRISASAAAITRCA